MVQLQIKKKDGVTSVDIPQDVLERLGVTDEGVLYAAETPDGLVITTRNVDVEQQMKIANSVMERYDEVLRKLAQ
jgi:putative addiction module antidote